MPTPSPIMMPIVAVKSGISMRLLISAVISAPVPTPASAIAIGRPIASTDPNAAISTKIANAMPSISELGGSRSRNMSPPSANSIPSISGAIEMISSPILPPSAVVVPGSRISWAYAIFPAPSALVEIWLPPIGEYGLTTFTTPSICFVSSNSSDIAACTSGSVTPCSARNTMVPCHLLHSGMRRRGSPDPHCSQRPER